MNFAFPLNCIASFKNCLYHKGMSKKVTIDSILARLTEEASRPAIKEICVDAINEIQRLRSICSEAQVFIQHASNCGTSMEWAKDCSCGYDQMWSKLDV